MSSGTPSEKTPVAGIHVHQARDVTIRAVGDVVGGNKTTIHNYYGPKPQDITKAPYKFLSYYDIGDRDIFFGRDAVIEELAGEIPRQKVLIINGQSGSGKTSLINAGLIPRLAENGYLYVYFRDYTNPLEQLREYFRDHPDFALPDADKLSLLQILRSIRSQQESPVVVIFDQFERFLINVAADPRREFLQQLRECLESDLTANELNLVISLRDDFYGKLLLEAEVIIPTLGSDSHHHNLRTLNRDEARQAIIQPLKNIPNIGFDGKFVDDVLLPHLMGQATGEAKIEPPHLQIVCNQLYEAARDRYHQQLEDGEPVRIGFDLYHDLGETEGMLRDYLDDVVRRITNGDANQIAVVRSTLKLMIETVGTRKFESIDDISTNLPDVARTETERIIQKLQESRVLEAKQSGSETEYSLSHEFMVAKVESWYDEREIQRRRAKEVLGRGLLAWKSTHSVLDAHQVQLIEKWLPNETSTDATELLTESKRRSTRQIWLKRLAIAGVLAAAIFMPVSVVLWKRADKQRDIAVENEREANRQLSNVSWQLGVVDRDRGMRIRAGHHFLLGAQSSRKANDESRVASLLIANTHLADGVVQTFIHDGVVQGGSLSRNGSKVITWGSDGMLKFWAVGQDKPLRSFDRKSSVEGAAFTQDEKRILCWTNDGTVALWDIAEEEPVRNFGHAEHVIGAVLSRDETRVFTWGVGGKATLWDVDQREPLRTFTHLNTVLHAAFLAEDTRIVTWDNRGMARLWDITQKEPLRTFDSGDSLPSIGPLFTQDGTQRLSWRNRTVQLTDVPHGRVIREFTHQRPVQGAFFSPDETRIVTWTDTEALLWDVMLQDVAIHTFPYRNTMNISLRGPILSGDQSLILTWGDNNTVELRDVAEGRLLQSFRHEDSINGASFGADAEVVLTWSYDGTARLWNVTHDNAVRTFPHQGPVLGGTANRDGTRLLTWSNNVVSWWDRTQNKPIRTFQQNRRVFNAQLLSDERRILAWGDERLIYLWNIDEEKYVRTFPHNSTVRGASLNHEMSLLLSWSNDIVYLWKISQATPWRQWRHTNTRGVVAAAFTPDERGVVTWSADGTCRMFRLTEELPYQTKQHSVDSRLPQREEMGYVKASFSKDATRVLTCGGSEVRLWDVTEERPLHRYPHANGVIGAAFSPSESLVLTWSFDRTAVLWDVTLSDPVRVFDHEKAVLRATFNQDGTRILTASEDGAVKLWDIAMDEPLRTFYHGGTLVGDEDMLVAGAAFVQDESFVLTWGKDGTARIWDVRHARGIPIEEQIRRYSIRTGTRLDAAGRLRILSFHDWVELLDPMR